MRYAMSCLLPVLLSLIGDPAWARADAVTDIGASGGSRSIAAAGEAPARAGSGAPAATGAGTIAGGPAGAAPVGPDGVGPANNSVGSNAAPARSDGVQPPSASVQATTDAATRGNDPARAGSSAPVAVGAGADAGASAGAAPGDVSRGRNPVDPAPMARGDTAPACGASGSCPAPQRSASATAIAASATAFNPKILAQWNLLGNTGSVPLDVSSLFGTQDAPIAEVSPYVLSVWKWVVNQDTGAGNWAFFTPSLTKAESDAAALAQGYEALSTIDPGEGFWVNRTVSPETSVPVTLNGPASARFEYDPDRFGALRKNAWYLIATGRPVAPSVFNDSDVNPVPPSPGVVPTDNFQTLWAWCAATQNWYFYAAPIEARGYASADGTVYRGLDAVRQAALDAGYLDFQTANPVPKTLGTGMGFWVHR